MGTGKQLSSVRRGQVYLVRLDPTLGAEIKKTRPAVVIQADVYNRHGTTTIVVPITSRKGPEVYPTEVVIRKGEGGLKVDSLARTRQVRTVDRRGLVKRLGAVKPATLLAIERAFLIAFGMLDL